MIQGARSPGKGTAVSWPTCGQAWIGLMWHVLDDCAVAPDDRGQVFEGRAALFEITGFCRTDPILMEFGAPAKMALYDRKFTENAICPPFKYSYGARLRECGGVDQLAWVTRLLADRPYSKSGWISLTLPGEQPRAVPCLTALAFRIRGEAVGISAIFRSQNAFTAYLNYLPLRDIQASIAGRLGLSCGPMRVYIDVPHVYVADASEALEILRAAPAPEPM